MSQPEAWAASTVHDITERPSMWTTQAPHWVVSQPTWVPVRRRFSRRKVTSRVRSSTSAETSRPLTVILTLAMDFFPFRGDPPVASDTRDDEHEHDDGD